MGNDVSSSITSIRSEEDRRQAIRRMDGALQKKLGKGVAHNLKIIIRGERGSGKSALLSRLKGQPFTSSVYEPTPEIETATINWSAKEDGAVVKVEIWDVVDKGLGRRGSLIGNNVRGTGTVAHDGGGDPDALAGLPLDVPVHAQRGHHAGASGSHAFGVLDATIVDVWKGSHGGIFMMNPFSSTALQYVQKQLAEVPRGIPVLLLANFRDLLLDDTQEGRKLEEDTKHEGESVEAAPVRPRRVHFNLRDLQEVSAEQTAQGRTCHAFACSMQNCFGLAQLYAYLNIPFLAMKGDVLERQLSETRRVLSAMTLEVEEGIDRGSWGDYVAALRAKEEDHAPVIEKSNKEARKPQSVRVLPDTVVPGTSRENTGVTRSKGEGHKPVGHVSSPAAAVASKHPRPIQGDPQAWPGVTCRSTQGPQRSSVQESGLVDVEDFKFQPREGNEQNELTLFLAEAEGGSTEDDMNEERRRQSLRSCLKPGSLASLSEAQRRATGVVGSGDVREGDEGEEDEDLPAEEGEQRYVGLRPVNLPAKDISLSERGCNADRGKGSLSDDQKKGLVGPLSVHEDGLGVWMTAQGKESDGKDDIDIPAGLPLPLHSLDLSQADSSEGEDCDQGIFNRKIQQPGDSSLQRTGNNMEGSLSSFSNSSTTAAPLPLEGLADKTDFVLSKAARAAIAATMEELNGRSPGEDLANGDLSRREQRSAGKMKTKASEGKRKRRNSSGNGGQSV
ncbi:gtp-binding protein parf [Nannochloropsis gaditana]|uniref:Gtp-binding protein parf n=4 Tax=Nannochloropsis gaditana TaxID=72520 RepID=W7TWE0_9STRA|nr:gtp-binding protein parf [Nannochloropsis gaditana]